jgi:general secretion pathway protein K
MKDTPGVPTRERGAALLTVLLLVAVIGAIAATAVERMRLSTAMAANGAANEQARAYATGIAQLMTLTVEDFAARSPTRTSLPATGLARRVTFPGGGHAEGRVRDGSTCFNLNSLVEGDAPARALRARQVGVEQFVRLAEALGIDAARARSLAETAADWADSDSAPLAAGAEDQAYAAQGYRAANTLFADRTELRAIAGMTPDLYARLAPFLCARPVAELSEINVNSLDPDRAVLLATLLPGEWIASAKATLARRPPGGWREIADFWSEGPMAELTASADAFGQLRTHSRWFEFELAVSVGTAEAIESGLIEVNRPKARLVARRRGPAE